MAFQDTVITQIPGGLDLARLQQILVQSKTQSDNPALYQTIQGLIKQAQAQMNITQNNVTNIDNKIIAGGAGITQLTGDVTAGPGTGSQVATIANNAVTTAKIINNAVTTAKITDANVTYAKIQNVTNDRVLGRDTAGSGVVEELTITQALKWLAVTSWTPVLKFGGGTTGITYTTQTAHYLRFGWLVVVWLHIVLSSKGSSTGAATITGLPFNINNEAGTFFGPFFANMNSMKALFGLGATGGTLFALNHEDPTGSTPCDDTHFNNNTEIYFGGFYSTNDA